MSIKQETITNMEGVQGDLTKILVKKTLKENLVVQKRCPMVQFTQDNGSMD